MQSAPQQPCVPVTFGSPSFHGRNVGGLALTDARFPPGQVLQPHIHERATLALMLEGGFDCLLPGKTLPCEPGTLHTEPAEERHGNRMGSAGAHVLVIQPDAAAAEDIRPYTDLLDRVALCPQSPASGIAWRLAAELYASDSAAPLAIEGLATELFALAARVLDRREPRPPRWLTRAQEYIHARFRNAPSIGEIARAVEVHPVRLARGFRSHFGVSIGTYVRRLRLDWAAVELATSRVPLSTLAIRAGFADQSHFTRAFRSHQGVTPHRYRDQAR